MIKQVISWWRIASPNWVSICKDYGLQPVRWQTELIVLTNVFYIFYLKFKRTQCVKWLTGAKAQQTITQHHKASQSITKHNTAWNVSLILWTRCSRFQWWKYEKWPYMSQRYTYLFMTMVWAVVNNVLFSFVCCYFCFHARNSKYFRTHGEIDIAIWFKRNLLYGISGRHMASQTWVNIDAEIASCLTTPCHYLNQQLIVIWTLGNKIQWSFFDHKKSNWKYRQPNARHLSWPPCGYVVAVVAGLVVYVTGTHYTHSPYQEGYIPHAATPSLPQIDTRKPLKNSAYPKSVLLWYKDPWWPQA